MATTDDRYRVQSLGRGLELLDLIARRGREGGRLSDLAREISLSKAACYAMLQTLLARGYIADRGKGIERRYRLGMTLVRLGEQAIGNIALSDIAVPVLRDLTAAVGLTSRVAVLDDGYAVVVGRVDAPGAIRFDAALGRRELPHCSAVGKALLASLPSEQARAILHRTGLPERSPHTLTTESALMHDLADTLRRGYAIDDEEDTEGVMCVGACVFDRSGAAAGAISVTGLKQRILDRGTDIVGHAVIRHADRISAAMGGPPVAEAWRERRAGQQPA
ncbi:MAG: IclR family transcriptional regulator [Dongiaceae bacterium]